MDAEFFEQLAMPLFEPLYNYAHWLTGDRLDAEELVQETYFKALRGFSSFKAGTNLRAWMHSILRNAFLTSRAGLAARNTFSLEDETEWPAAASSDPESLLIRLEGQQSVLDALAALPLPAREVLLLCEVEELSYRDIAAVLSVPIGTVMSRLSRARRLLREAVMAQTAASPKAQNEVRP